MRAFRTLLILALLGTGTAFAAGRKPSEFAAPSQMTEEELAEAKARSKNGRLNGYDERGEEKPKPFPWMLAGLVGISFLVATPFALRSFRGTSKEIAESAEALGLGRNRGD